MCLEAGCNGTGLYIPALGKLRLEDVKFQAGLGFIGETLSQKKGQRKTERLRVAILYPTETASSHCPLKLRELSQAGVCARASRAAQAGTAAPGVCQGLRREGRVLRQLASMLHVSLSARHMSFGRVILSQPPISQ